MNRESIRGDQELQSGAGRGRRIWPSGCHGGPWRGPEKTGVIPVTRTHDREGRIHPNLGWSAQRRAQAEEETEVGDDPRTLDGARWIPWVVEGRRRRMDLSIARTHQTLGEDHTRAPSGTTSRAQQLDHSAEQTKQNVPL